ncbi:hypothetical protein TNCV_1106051 [Trichonephila clavipes]|nr:hypothetical protein TNCV_1106051 [Trichonephila clavipes]
MSAGINRVRAVLTSSGVMENIRALRRRQVLAQKPDLTISRIMIVISPCSGLQVIMEP